MDFDFDDISTIDEPVWFQVEHPVTGELLVAKGTTLPVRLALLGPDTTKMKAVENKIQDRRLERVGKTGKLQLTASQIESENRERALASITGWENFRIGGEMAVFSVKALTELFARSPWLERFWEEKYRNAGNFLGSAESTETS